MTAVDWARETVVAFRHEPLDAAVRSSVGDLLRGVRSRWLALRYRLGVGFSPTTCGGVAMATTLAGVPCQFMVETQQDLRRADTLLGEEPVLAWFIDGMVPGEVVWDVGAFHGHYSVVAAHLGAHVVAFEPVVANRQRLCRNLFHNDVAGSYAVESVGLSDRNDDRRIGAERLPESAIGDGAEVVTVVRGDAVHRPLPDRVKVDVEGHEIAVLDGLAETLRSVSRVVVEVHDRVPPSAVRDRLHAAGLTTRVIPTGRSQTYIGGFRA